MNGYPPPPPFGGQPTAWPPQAAPPATPYPNALQPGAYPPVPAAPQYPAPPAAPYGAPPPGYPPSAPQQNPYAQRPGGYPPAPPQQAPGYGRPNIMSGMDDVDPTGSRLPHFNAGHRYVVRNESIEFFDGRKASFLASEWHILESDDPQLPPGREAKYMIKWGQDMSLPNTKALLGALEGLTDEDQIKTVITEAKSLDAIDKQKQPHRGKILELRTVATTTRGGGPFTVHNWAPIGGAAAPAPSVSQGVMAAYASAATGAPLSTYMPQPAQQMQAPPAYAPPPAAAPFPPPGWMAHPQAPGYFHNGKVSVIEAELRAMQAQGRA